MTFALRPTYRRQVALQASYLPESRALFAAATVQPTPGRKGHIDKFIRALKAAGVWSKIDAMWVLAAHDEQFGRLNWISPGSFTLTAVNSPTFTTDRHFAGDNSTSYLDTGWDPATNGVQISQNNAHVSVYQRNNGGSTTPPFSIQTNGAPLSAQARGTANQNVTKVNSSTSVPSSSSAVTLPVQIIGRRNLSTDASSLIDGVQIGALTAATSSALSSTDMAFGKTGTVYTSSQVAGGTVGAYLDDTEALAFYNAWHTYMVAVGADT